MATGYNKDVVSTSETNRKERPDLWLQHCRDLQGEFFLSFPDGDFEGTTKFQLLQDAAVVEFNTSAIAYNRRARHLADGAEGVRLVTPLHKSLNLTQQRDSADITLGSVGVFNMGRPMTMAHGSGTRALIVSIPNDKTTRRLFDRAPVLLPGNKPLVSMLCRQMEQMAAHYAKMTAHEFNAGIDALALLLERVILGEQLEDDQADVDQIWRYILEHSDNPGLDVAGIAAGLHCSVRHLHKVMKDNGTTPGKILTETRLQRALDRMRRTGGTIEEIAAGSGFGTADSFRRNCLDHHGITPRQMREKLAAEGGWAQH